jgi:hypothetical protein
MSVNSSRCRRLLPSLAPPARTILPATKRGVKRRRRQPARQREPLSSGAALLAPSMRGAHAPTRPLLFVRGSSGPRIEPPAGDCRFRGRAAVFTCVSAACPQRACLLSLHSTLALHESSRAASRVGSDGTKGPADEHFPARSTLRHGPPIDPGPIDPEVNGHGVNAPHGCVREHRACRGQRRRSQPGRLGLPGLTRRRTGA